MLCYADESGDEAGGRAAVGYEAEQQGRCNQPDDHHEGQDGADEEQDNAGDYQLHRFFHLMVALINPVAILPVVVLKQAIAWKRPKCLNPNAN